MHTRDLLAGAGLGAALAFMLDPAGGGRRRALARDKLVFVARKTRDGLDAASRDVTNRARGMAVAARARWSSENVDDETLIERVRATLGRACSHPRAIDVEARDGIVTLRGPILSHEVNPVVSMAASVRGVRQAVNELEAHDSREGIPSLQGEGRLAGSTWDVLQRPWSPAIAALVGVSLVAAAAMAAAYRRSGANEHTMESAVA